MYSQEKEDATQNKKLNHAGYKSEEKGSGIDAWSQWMDNVLKPARFNVSPTAPIAAKLWQYWLTIFKNFSETIQQDDLNKPTVLISFVSADVYEIFLRRCQL